MTTKSKIVLHVGAPKCGSSALQSALSQSPTHRTQNGGRLRYVALRQINGTWATIQGRPLRIARELSAYGYVSWPNLSRHEDPSIVFQKMDQIWYSNKRNLTTVLSNEGWANQSALFARHVPHWFDPGQSSTEIDVFAFARPPLDWLNSAYWQWGVWSGRNFEGWLKSELMNFTLGSDFTAWAALPNVRLKLHLQGSSVDEFASEYAINLPKPKAPNATLPPALIGFLLRNRSYRKMAHDSSTEFVFQRWCRLDNSKKLWAILPRHIQSVRAQYREEVGKLFALLPDETVDAIRSTDPRWVSDRPYHELAEKGRSNLENTEDAAELYKSLGDGIERLSIALGQTVPTLDPPPPATADISVWDQRVTKAMDQLLSLERSYRSNPLKVFKRAILNG